MTTAKKGSTSQAASSTRRRSASGRSGSTRKASGVRKASGPKTAKSTTTATATSAATQPKSVFEAWEAAVVSPEQFAKLSKLGNVLEQQPLHGGVVMVVDGALRTTVVRKQRGKRMRNVRILPLYNIQFPEGGVRPDHIVAPNTVPGTRLNGLFNYRTNGTDSLAAAAVVPDSFEVSKTTLGGVSGTTKTARTAFAKKLLTAYHKAMKKASPEQPQKDVRAGGLVEQVAKWVESVQAAIDDQDDSQKSVHIRFVEVPYKASDANASTRPANTRLMVPFAKAHASIGRYFVRERGARFGDGSAYCREVGPKDSAHSSGYLALNVDKSGKLMPNSHVSHVRKEEHDYMCRKV